MVENNIVGENDFDSKVPNKPSEQSSILEGIQTPIQSPKPLESPKPELRDYPLHAKLSNFRDSVWLKVFNMSERNVVRKKVFEKFFDYYVQYKEMNMLEEFKWVIGSEYFDDDDTWNNYFKKARLYRWFCKEESSLLKGIMIPEPLKKRMILYMNMFYDSMFSKDKEVNVEEAEEFQEGDKMKGFYSLEEFKKLYPDFNPKVDKNKEYYIPKMLIESTNICDMVLRFAPNRPNFLPNPNIKISAYNYDDGKTVNKVKIRVRKSMKLFGKNNIIGSYDFICPKCKSVVSLKSDQMGATRFYHDQCPKTENGKGKRKNVLLRMSSRSNGKELSVYCYEVNCFNDKDELLSEREFFYSFNTKIRPGVYFADVVNLQGRLLSPEDNDKKAMILGIERATYKPLPDLITKERGEEIAKVFGCKHHKIFDVLGGVYKYYSKHQMIHINPRRGAFIQLGLIFTALSRVIFKDKNFPIVVIGDTSVSKTFPLKTIGPLMDVDYRLASGPSSQTYAGIYGGVGQVMLYDKKMKVFQEGSAGAGIVGLDEGAIWFDPTKDFNENLKSLPNAEIDNMKVGAEKVIQRFTPVIFFNFTKYHKGELSQQNFRDRSYEGEIKFYYWKIVKDIDNIPYHEERKKSSADAYVNSQNLYLPLQMFENEYLREAIALVRNMRTKQDICWWSGGSIPAQNRFLIDTVVKKGKNNYQEPFSDYSQIRASFNVYEIATVDFIEAVRQYIRGDERINLGKFLDNSPEVVERYTKLRKNVVSYLKNDPHIKLHFSDDGRIDDKLELLIISFYIALQFINDVHATELDEATKDVAKKFLLKCKRGLTEDEYNFVDNSYLPDAKIINDTKYSADQSLYRAQKLHISEKDKKMVNEIAEKVKQEIKHSELKEIDVNNVVVVDDSDDFGNENYDYLDDDEKWMS